MRPVRRIFTAQVEKKSLLLFNCVNYKKPAGNPQAFFYPHFARGTSPPSSKRNTLQLSSISSVMNTRGSMG